MGEKAILKGNAVPLSHFLLTERSTSAQLARKPLLGMAKKSQLVARDTAFLFSAFQQKLGNAVSSICVHLEERWGIG